MAVRQRGLSLCLLLGAAALLPEAAHADFQVRSPIVEEGEWEYEQNGDVTRDKNPAKDHEFSLTNEIGHSVTSWWEPELELETDRDPGPGERFRLSAITLENTFQLTEQGEYWVDVGMFGEYSHSLRNGDASDFEIGPLFQKQVGPTLHTLNILFARELGPSQDDRDVTMEYAWQSLWRLSSWASPGVELYGAPGDVRHFASWNQQEARVGPVVVGGIPLGQNLGEVKYELGYLQGLTQATPASTFRWRIEWELHF